MADTKGPIDTESHPRESQLASAFITHVTPVCLFVMRFEKRPESSTEDGTSSLTRWGSLPIRSATLRHG